MTESAYQPAGFCPHCGYRIDPGRCPECGREVKRPWRVPPRTYRRRRRLVVAAIVAAILVGAGVPSWRFGPGLAARYTPSSVLVWIWDMNWIGTDWADNILDNRLLQARTWIGGAGDDVWREFAARSETFNRDDWRGMYEIMTLSRVFARRLAVTDTDGVWNTDMMFNPGDLVCGRIAAFDGLTLHLDIPADRHVLRWAKFDSELILIRWDDWRYLAAREELLDFCNDVNAGEPLIELHLTRPPPGVPGSDKCRGRPRTDQPPDLPPEYRRYILREPLLATITQCSERSLPNRRKICEIQKESERRATLASTQVDLFCYEIQLDACAGSDPFVGMRLYAQNRVGLAQVTRVRGKTMNAIYVEWASTQLHQALPRGLVLSTLAPPQVPLTPAVDNERLVTRNTRLRRLPSGQPTNPVETAEVRATLGWPDAMLLV